MWFLLGAGTKLRIKNMSGTYESKQLKKVLLSFEDLAVFGNQLFVNVESLTAKRVVTFS